MAGVRDTFEDLNATYIRMSRGCVIGLYAMSAIWGALQIAFPGNGILYLSSALLFATFASGWAMLDARVRGIRIPHVLQMFYFFVWPIGAVIYLLYRSGMRGLFTAMVHGIGLTTTLALAFYSTLFGLHHAGMLDPVFYQ